MSEKTKSAALKAEVERLKLAHKRSVRDVWIWAAQMCREEANERFRWPTPDSTPEGNGTLAFDELANKMLGEANKVYQEEKKS